MTIYSVIDIDPTGAMHYEPGEEVLGTAEAATPEEAINEVLKTCIPGLWNARAFDPKGFDTWVSPHLKAVPVG